MSTHLHLGVLANGTTDAVTADALTDGTAEAFRKVGAIVDGDSFSTWTESLTGQSGDPLHVVVPVSDALADDPRAVAMMRACLTHHLHSAYTFAGYSVLTAADDWSVDVRIVTESPVPSGVSAAIR